MKKVLLFLLALVCGFIELIEVLALPILFLILGLWQDLPWQYYVITIGSYFALFFLLELALHFIFKKLDKKYSSRFARKIEQIISRFSKEKNP